MLFLLANSEGVNNNDLITKTGISKNAINQIKAGLQTLFKPPSVKTVLLQELKSEVTSLFDHSYATEESLVRLPDLSTIPDILNYRVDPKRAFDQFMTTPETVMKRVELMNFLKDIDSKRILFLGDDDNTSLAVALKKTASKITVVDIDQRVLDGIRSLANDYGFAVETIHHDLKFALPKNLLSSYDIVFTDPPYTPEGAGLFLSRAVSAVDTSNLAARIYVCYGASDRAKERFLPIHDTITAHGLMLRYVFDKFNRYTGAESIGNTSSLFVAEATPKLKSIIKNTYHDPIYTNN